MDRTERLYRIEQLIRVRGHASFAQLQQQLEVSRATLWRDIEYLRSRLGAPIEYDRFVNGYRFGAAGGTPGSRAPASGGGTHELPGLWFSERELYALLMAHQLLGELDTDELLGRHLQPLLGRIDALLAAGRPGSAGAPALLQRVHIIGSARRPAPALFFERAVEALLKRRQLQLRYRTRTRGNEPSERRVSPQRLVHHRNTWYLDAWCHRVQALRRFALDAMEAAVLQDDAARELPLADVQAAMDAGYGAFAGTGAQRRWAVLHVDATAARWLSREQWHPEQQGRWLDDGRYELRVPYVDELELARDLMRQSAELVVHQPASLRQALQRLLGQALARNRDEPGLA